MLLLDDQAANTDGSQDELTWQGGTGTVVAEGTFDTCTITVKCQWNDGECHTYDATTTFTAAGIAPITLPKGFKIRGDVTSVGGGTLATLNVIHPS